MNYCPTCSAELALRRIDGQERLSCSDECGFVFWDNPVPVVAGLIHVRDEFILARNVAWPEGAFSLISGFVEKGEDPEVSIKRETKEELGLDAKDVQLIGHYPFLLMNQLIIAYYVRAEGLIITNGELVDYRRIKESDICEYDFGAFKLGEYVVNDWVRLKDDG